MKVNYEEKAKENLSKEYDRARGRVLKAGGNKFGKELLPVDGIQTQWRGCGCSPLWISFGFPGRGLVQISGLKLVRNRSCCRVTTAAWPVQTPGDLVIGASREGSH